MKRIVGGLALVVVLAAGGLLWYARSSLDGVVKAAIERHGAELLLAPVQVEGVHIELQTGRGTIRGITVGNPEGFPDGTAILLGEITVAVQPRTLRSSPIVVDEIRIGAPHVNVVLDADGRMNVDELRRSAKRYASRRQQPGRPAQEAGAGDGEGAVTRLRVGEITIADGSIRLDASALGRAAEELPLGEVALRDVGGERGATPEQLGRRVGDALIGRTARAVAGAEVKRALRDKGGAIGERLGELLQRGLDR